jgi:hypothetical protein
MPRKPMQTNQGKLLYIESLLGINNTLELVEDKTRNSYNHKSSTKVKDDCKVIELKKVD